MNGFLKVNQNVDYQDFVKALKFYTKNYHGDLVRAINHQSGNFIMKITNSVYHPEAVPKRIYSDTNKMYQTRLPNRKGKAPMNMLVGMAFAYSKPRSTANKNQPRISLKFGGGSSRKVIGDAIRKVINIRVNAAGYIRRGWIQLGPTFDRWTKTKSALKGNQRKLVGTVAYRATPQKMWSFMRNGAKGAGTVSAGPTDKALKLTIADMVDYAHRKIKENAKKAGFKSTN